MAENKKGKSAAVNPKTGFVAKPTAPGKVGFPNAGKQNIKTAKDAK